ncbi:MAG: hypothetical protein AB7K52_03915 [Phycisphaerales bacterium]
MFDPLSIVPLWAMLVIGLALGVVAGGVQVARGFSRRTALAVLGVLALGLGVTQAIRWDWNTRDAILGGPADSDKRLRLEAQGTGRSYSERRQRWLAMSDGERWIWRLTMLVATTGSLLAGGVPTIVFKTRAGGGSAGGGVGGSAVGVVARRSPKTP